jgi:hypothetical protein
MSLWLFSPDKEAAALLGPDAAVVVSTVASSAAVPAPTMLADAIAAVAVIVSFGATPAVDVAATAISTPPTLQIIAIVRDPSLPGGNRCIMPDGRHGQVVDLPEGEDPAFVAVVADEDVQHLDSTLYVVTYDPADLVPE